MDVLSITLSAISTTYCPVCRSHSNGVCNRCAADIKEQSLQTCIICGLYTAKGRTHKACIHPTSPRSFISPYEYVGAVRTIILNCKRHKTPKDLIPLIDARQFTEALQQLNQDINLITYIPDNFIFPRFRFLNPPALLAQKISAEIKKPIQKIIIKKPFTKQQKGLNREKRTANAASSYLVRKSLSQQIKGRRILLVDDVSTTGATFIAISKLLLVLGATSVDCFALSKDVLD